MQPKRNLTFLTILFQLLFFSFLSGMESYQENPLTKAIQLFDKEKYTEAEPIFKDLLNDRPDDFMVNYFYGACRTENGYYGEKELNYLLNASKEVNPLNIDYYIAIQYHALNEWDRAMGFYRLFQSVTSQNDQEKVGLAEKIEQCSNRINPFVSKSDYEETLAPEMVTSESAAVATVGAISSDENPTDSTTLNDSIALDYKLDLDSIVDDSLNEFRVPVEENIVSTILVEEQINFHVNSEITYLILDNFQTEEGRAYFEEGNEKQEELDKVVLQTEILRENYAESKSRSERDSIGKQILGLEGETYEMNRVVNQLFQLAKNSENEYWQTASIAERENFIEELDEISMQINGGNNTSEIEEIPEPSVYIIPPLIDKEAPDSEETAIENNSGISYKIQLGAYSRGIPNSMKPVFKKISILRKVENYTDENGVVVYTTGNLTNYEDAVVMQKQVKQEGVKDCKIAAYLNGKRITLEQAKELDKNR